MIQTKECPSCKKIIGWFEKVRTSYRQYYNPNGEGSNTSEGVTHGGTRKYCFDCNRDITDLVIEELMWNYDLTEMPTDGQEFIALIDGEELRISWQETRY